MESPKRALEFYVDVLGLAPMQAQDFEEDRASFPTVRLSETTILDLMDRSKVPVVGEEFSSETIVGQRVVAQRDHP